MDKIAISPTGRILMKIYDLLFSAFGPQNWWPAETDLEMMVGAILTQNTAWVNVEKALMNLANNNLFDAGIIRDTKIENIKDIIKPAGYYNQKARRLKTLAECFSSKIKITREVLLELSGIGPETADSIMLYAFGKLYFIVDAYTRRIFGRIGVIDEISSYEEIRSIFEASLPRRISLYQEYHALIVEHGKRICRKDPLCAACTIAGLCKRRGKGPGSV